MKIEITKNNTDKILKELEEQIPVALEAVGLQAETYVKMKCPVDTGLLRNSITHVVSGEHISKSYHAEYGSNRSKKGNRLRASSKNAGKVNVGSIEGTIGNADEKAVYVGTNVEYAPYVEYGTSAQKPQPFFKPGIMDHLNQYSKILREYLKKEE